MISILPHGLGMLSSAVIAADDDERCGHCFGEGYTPMAPPHEYAAHMLVRLPAETYEVITDRYVLWPLFGAGSERAWAAGLESCVAWLEANGYTVRAMRRQFHALADASS